VWASNSPYYTTSSSNRSPTTFWIHILAGFQDETTTIFSIILQTSVMFPMFMFFYEAKGLSQVSKVRSDLTFMIIDLTSWHMTWSTLGTILLIICFLLLLIVKLLNYPKLHLEKRSKRVLPTDFLFSFSSKTVHKKNEMEGGFFFISIILCSYHRTFSGSFYLLYYVRLTLRSGVDSKRRLRNLLYFFFTFTFTFWTTTMCTTTVMMVAQYNNFFLTLVVPKPLCNPAGIIVILHRVIQN